MLTIKIVFRSLLKSDFMKKTKEFSRKAFSEKYLLYTNVTISLALSSVGDVLEQQYERYLGELDQWQQRRTAHMGISGMTVGTVCHYWYKYLDRRFPGRSFAVVLKKVVLDQFICSPAYITVFFLTLGALENKTLPETIKEIKQKAWKLYAAEWAIWPVAQVINFYWLPTKYRVLYDNTISLGFDIFTSQVKHKEDS